MFCFNYLVIIYDYKIYDAKIILKLVNLLRILEYRDENHSNY